MRIFMLALLVVALHVLPTTAAAADGRAYLTASLDESGCAREPGGPANVQLTGWVLLGLAASGAPTKSAAACIERNAARLATATDLELAILALVAAGRDPRRAGGRDLVTDLERLRRGGRIGPTVASTQFGALALRAAGRPVPASVRRQLLRDQNRNGSWSAVGGDGGDSNVTASGIQALIAVGVPRRHPAVRRGLAALAGFRTAEGGYAAVPGGRADAQSTAWALQALAAVGRRDPAGERYLRGLRQTDGSYAYRRGMRITPVWVTAQVLPGLERRPFGRP